MKGLITVLAFALSLSFWVFLTSRDQAKFNQDNQGQITLELPFNAFEFFLIDAIGHTVNLTQFKGKPILLNFWATWCPPCIEELPSLLEFAEKSRKNLDLVTLAVSVDESWEPIHQIFENKKLWSGTLLPLTILLDKDGSVPRAYGTLKYPETLFINKEFKVIRKFIGVQDWASEEIMEWITAHSG